MSENERVERLPADTATVATPGTETLKEIS